SGDVAVLCRLPAGAMTLADRLQRGALEPETALDCVMQIAERLAPWHERGVAHGYLRPETVLLDGSGIALLEPRLHAPAAAALIRHSGTPPEEGYAAPESDRFAAEALAADVYALGCMLVHMLLGRAPRLAPGGGLDGASLLEALPGPLQRTMAAALHADP